MTHETEWIARIFFERCFQFYIFSWKLHHADLFHVHIFSNWSITSVFSIKIIFHLNYFHESRLMCSQNVASNFHRSAIAFAKKNTTFKLIGREIEIINLLSDWICCVINNFHILYLHHIFSIDKIPFIIILTFEFLDIQIHHESKWSYQLLKSTISS